MAGKPLVYWDSCIFIAHLKNENRSNPLDMQGVGELVRRIDGGDIGLVTSVIALPEVLESTLPKDAIRDFRAYLSRPDVLLIDVDRRIAEISHEIRDFYQNDGSGEKTVSTPDAIHLATAISKGCPVFYTFDGDAKQKTDRSRVLLPLGNNIAGKYSLKIQKPEPTQLALDFPIAVQGGETKP